MTRQGSAVYNKKAGNNGKPQPMQPAHQSRPSERNARGSKKNTAILAVALFLLLIKIVAGTYYIVFDHDAKSTSAATSPEEQLLEIEKKLAQNSNQSQLAQQGRQAEQKSAVDEYIAAAAEVVSPAKAQAVSSQSAAVAATHIPAASVSTNAIAAGAFMVLGSQSASNEAAKGGISSIPLPPDSNDLLQPGSQLPEPDLPKIPDVPGSIPPEKSLAGGDPNSAYRELRAKENDLSQREAALSSRTEALNTLEEELNKRLQSIESARTEIESMTKRNEAILAEQKALRDQQQKEDQIKKDASTQHMVVALKSMKPEQAGALVNSLDDEVAVSIFSAMPPRNVGLILAFVDPEKAARIAKAISERRIDPNLASESTPASQ